jgi:transposase
MGRSKGGLSTKIHALTDALGNPLAFHLTRDAVGRLDNFPDHSFDKVQR